MKLSKNVSIKKRSPKLIFLNKKISDLDYFWHLNWRWNRLCFTISFVGPNLFWSFSWCIAGFLQIPMTYELVRNSPGASIFSLFDRMAVVNLYKFTLWILFQILFSSFLVTYYYICRSFCKKFRQGKPILGELIGKKPSRNWYFVTKIVLTYCEKKLF